ncbi:hypothetical protein Q0590_18490 [Rhodocytophaga aerolata]|uniref:Uncharacterized protein n=1 Tax=Rhodocytophaga aerolata TaxID=455078 RepID=A0ABT8RC40_9BACT|nr:hypothetical protein [Rhodocytophaga aerolata]MDO1448270.1 hypothetical protein [Rhodocytophaga aerolata]
MKNPLHCLKFLFTISLLLCFAAHASLQAQGMANAGSYMSYIGDQQREIMKDFMSYTSAVAHGKSARKVESRRQELMKTMTDSRRKIASMAPYEGDKSLRDSTAKFLLTSYHVLNDDYGKIMNLEEVAEQSYDAMEAYLLAQKIAEDKIKEASNSLKTLEKEFAGKHHVNLVETKDELSEKVKIAGKVTAYNNMVYLVFFKSYKQELYLMDAIQKKNINGIEQNKSTLHKYAQEGLAKLDTMAAFNGDRTLLTACRQMLEFYRDECGKIAPITEYYLKEENFTKIKKAFEAKREKDRTQADVNQYNQAINELNTSVNSFNTANNQLNKSRSQLIDNWNKVSANFSDKHTPKYK